MLGIYCAGIHREKDGLCPDCDKLLQYALQRLTRCPFGEEKPTCEKCPVHCYRPEMRRRIREVMKYSGPRMLRGHPAMALQHVMRGLVHRTNRKT